MHTQDFLVDKCRYWQAVENISEYFPELDGVSTFTLIIKPVDAVDLSTFVVPSEKEKVLRVLDFVGHEETYSFN